MANEGIAAGACDAEYTVGRHAVIVHNVKGRGLPVSHDLKDFTLSEFCQVSSMPDTKRHTYPTLALTWTLRVAGTISTVNL
jgi:hypothetical protein